MTTSPERAFSLVRSNEPSSMQVVIADDNPVTRRLVEATILTLGHELTVCCDGLEAWDKLSGADVPSLAVLNWLMPGMEGVEIVRRARESNRKAPLYIILLTGKGQREDIVEGLKAGADDYVVKPFDHEELRARVIVGERVIALEQRLRERVVDLERVLSRVNQLQGLLPICSYCKKIRDDHNYWEQVESYVARHSDVRFRHSVCPDCYALHLKPALAKH